MDRLAGLGKLLYTAYILGPGKGRVERHRRWIEQFRAADWQTKESLQSDQLVKLYRFALRHVPFYREFYRDHGLSADSVHSMADLTKLPIVEKKDLHGIPLSQLKPPLLNRDVMLKASTSGSSGTPFVFYKSRGGFLLNGAQFLLYQQLWGLQKRRKVFWILYNVDPCLSVDLPYSSPYSLFNGSHSIKPDEETDLILAKIRSGRPDLVVAHPSMVEDICDLLLRRDESYPKEIAFATGGEVQTERLKQKCRQAFPEHRLFDFYNSVELGLAAVETERRIGMEINDYAVLIEKRNEVRDGDGTIYQTPVITNLWNFGTPLIRYGGIEDLLRLEEVPDSTDGRGWFGRERITAIIGRASEMIHRPEGKPFSVCILSSAHADLPGVERFQYVQRSPEKLTLRYTPLPGADPGLIAREAEQQTRKLLGNRIEFAVQEVDEIKKRGKSLKFPMLVKE